GFYQAAFGFKTNRINHGIYTPMTGSILDDKFCRIDFIKINRNRSIGLMGKTQAIRMVIDHKNLLGTQHAGTGGSKQTDWTCSINRKTGTATDLRIAHGLPSGGQNIRQEQDFFIW